MEFFRELVTKDNYTKASAGGVGTVGDPNTNVRLRRSSSELAPIFISRASRGSNITDGNNPAMYRVSGGARVYSDDTNDRPRYRENVTRIVDLIPSERLMMPKNCGTPKLSWAMLKRSSLSTNNTLFSQVPGGFGPKPGDVRRGQIPTRNVVVPV